ncbi:LOW QUALITY PROTEIN: GTPase IMAP family member 4 [Alosa sapidissima]|uniref:LOW QUALITY PROTEIN: GTPase IMAP family member 4 n=1 Tax=Alosa sapidissima TaxID=34773 RepID=UPI001C0A0B22|nr:LOW QUALITY PROTEIN: GTPase IMAP family member 4 [Alosa sapidissima]
MDDGNLQVRGSELRLLVLGPSRVGKSSLGNLLLGRQAFDTRGGWGTEAARGEASGRCLLLVDTYGWCSWEEEGDKEGDEDDGESWEEENEGRKRRRRKVSKSKKLELLGALILCDPGPHALLLVLPLLHFSRRESAALQARMELLTPRVWSHTVLVFTLGDKLDPGQGRTFQQYLEGTGEQLHWVLGACRYRCHVVNNKTAQDRVQVTRLLEKVEDQVQENGGWHFSLVMSCRMEEEWTCREREAKERREREGQEKHQEASLMDTWLRMDTVSSYSGRLQPKGSTH